MAELKKLSPKINTVLSIRDGWNFGIGFFAVAFIFTFIVIPAISCSAAIILAMLGLSLPTGG
jgi:hypothetical protein